jgi:UDP-N-acetylmuramate: L-alanyl-gamma-D-glutamyl-meso-diaminopimelate ligase
MDITNNTIPDHVKAIHLIAVCGTGMGALACMLKDSGFMVTGSDQHVYPPISTFLENHGIQVADGFDEKHIAYGPDLVVVGNAVSKDNPEVQAMLKMGLCFCSMPQALNHFVAGNKKSLVITGTHGKTTTSSILAWILFEAGKQDKQWDPSFMIGGILNNFNTNYRLGTGDFFVVEGDEYDTAFFDKGPKFLHFNPCMAILTSIEFDHADIFKDLDHVKDAFNRFISQMSQDSTLMAYDKDHHIDSLVPNAACRVERYGKNSNACWRLEDIRIDPPWTFFSVLRSGNVFATFKTKLIGEHNLYNALSAIGIADRLGIRVDAVQRALETFNGVKRRQEIRGVKNGVTVMDDFAHHPTAVRETIKAVKDHVLSGRLIAVFEPRTNSSMRDVFQHVYPLSFDHADVVCIRKPPLLKKIPEHQRFSSEKLVDDLISSGKTAHYFTDTQDIIAFLVKQVQPGDVVLIMSNGGFDNIHERLLQSL